MKKYQNEIIAGVIILLIVAVGFYLHYKSPTGLIGTKKPTGDKPGHDSRPADNAPAKLNPGLRMSLALKQGSTGAEVSELQDDLGNLGNGITVDGIWGPETAGALNAQLQAWGIAQPPSFTLGWWKATLNTKQFDGQPQKQTMAALQRANATAANSIISI